MKKTLKIIGISLASIVGLVLIVVAIACWLVLTPERATPIVRKQVPKFITCDFNIEKVDITVFKTFPDVSVEIENVALINPVKDSPSDTLAYIHNCTVSVNIKKLLFENEIIINNCKLNGGYINVFTDSQGNTNIDILSPSTASEKEDNSEWSYSIDLLALKLDDVLINYTDLTQGMIACVNGMGLSAKGKMKEDKITGNLDILINNLKYQQKIDTSSMTVYVKDMKIDGKGDFIDNNIQGDINCSTADVSYLGQTSHTQLAKLKSLTFNYIGSIKDDDTINGKADLNVNNLTFVMDDETYLDKANVNLDMPINLILNTINAEFGASHLAFNDILVDFMGNVSISNENDIDINMDVKTNTLVVEDVITLLPNSIREEILGNMDVMGKVQLDAHIQGLYNENSMPVIKADIKYNDGNFNLPEYIPYPISDFNTSLKANINLNNKSNLTINSLKARVKKSSVSISGTVNDLMNKMLCNLKLKADARLDELYKFIPEEIVAKGNVKLNVDAKFSKDQITNMDLIKSKINGDIQWDNMDIVYYDTVKINADRMYAKFSLPNTASRELTNSLAKINIDGNELKASITNMMNVNLRNYNIDAQVSNILEASEPLSVYTGFDFSKIDFDMGDILLFSDNASGTAKMLPSKNSDNVSYELGYSGDSLSFEMGDELEFKTKSIKVKASADYDENQEDIILQWNPQMNIDLTNAVFDMKSIKEPIHIPSIDFKYDTTGLIINNSNFVLGKSDFELKGTLTSFNDFLRKEDLLCGNFDFTSNYTDVNQLMDFFNGMGDTIQEEKNQVVTDTIKGEDNPFMVPLGVDISLNTKINNATAGAMKIANVGGKLIVKDGILVLEEMGFTSDAAKMFLTAIYKSPRKNHLYLGLDFHLLDIDIAEMIRIIPDLDTIVPMLKSFAGKAEFHLAAETYMKSNYELKISMLKGATAIQGKNLVVLDNKTYKKISKLLNFRNKNKNVIDSLSAEITVLKDEVDVYPFLITMDKYQAIVSGRHNLDMTFDYKFGMVKPPLISRLGLELTGNLDKIKYRFKYKKNLGLESLKGKESDIHVQEETIRLKSIIANSLKDNLKKNNNY